MSLYIHNYAWEMLIEFGPKHGDATHLAALALSIGQILKKRREGDKDGN